jgi:hypothetical protein
MPIQLDISVFANEFSPSYATGSPGETVIFLNRRNQSVTITLGEQFSQSSLPLVAYGSGSVTIKSTATGLAPFSAPYEQVSSPAQDKGIMTGDIDIDPSK